MKKNIFLLSWKKLGVVILLGFVSILLHNIFYAIIGYEEFMFFTIVVVILPIYLFITIIYTIVKKVKERKRRGKGR